MAGKDGVAAKNLASKLSAPFSPMQIHWRVGAQTKAKDKAIPLAFLNARDVMQRLDDAVGPENWQARYPFPGCCELGIRIGNEWVWKANGSDETDIEGVKGQYSGAFKRAAVLWGIGRYLYDMKNVWVPVENGRFSEETIGKLTDGLAKWQDRYFNQEAA